MCPVHTTNLCQFSTQSISASEAFNIVSGLSRMLRNGHSVHIWDLSRDFVLAAIGNMHSADLEENVMENGKSSYLPH